MLKKQVFIRVIVLHMPLLFVCSCQTIPSAKTAGQPPAVYWAEKKKKISPEKKRKIFNALNNVLTKAKKYPGIEQFGINTMKESILILNERKYAAPLIAEVILSTGAWSNKASLPYFWKFRFWCIDMAGYLRKKTIVRVLYDIAGNRNEDKKLRIRAVLSLKELSEKKLLRNLFLKTGQPEVREEIAKSILYLSR